MFCCHSSGLPDQVGKFKLIKAVPEEFRNGTVMPAQFQTAFKNLLMSMCCKKNKQ